MKTNFLLFLFALLSMFLLNYCKENTTQTPIGNNVILPLAVGNYWIGQNNMYNYDSTLNTRGSFLDTMRILFDTLILGNVWYKQNPYYYLRNDNDGLHIIKYSPLNTPYLGFKYPAIIGDTFMTIPICYIPNLDNPLILDSGYFYMQVKSTDTLINVPKGSFNCYEYRQYLIKFGYMEPTLLYPIYFYAPNVGPIKQVTYNKNPQGNTYLHYSWELLDYKLF
jgi:hypothetical protein